MTIFINSCSDTDSRIIRYSDYKSLLNLGCVNKAAEQKLNNTFFKKLFEIQHPILAKNENTFEILGKFLPSTCWKVTCSAFARGFFHINSSLIRESLPLISKALTSEKKQLEIEFIDVCRDIVISSKAVEKNAQLRSDLHKKFSEDGQLIQTLHSLEECLAIQFALNANKQKLLHLKDEELKEILMFLSGNDIQLLKRNHLPDYLSYLKFSIFEHRGDLHEARRNLQEAYKKLRQQQNTCQENLVKIDEKLNLLETSSTNPDAMQKAAAFYNGVFACEFEVQKENEEMLISISILEECQGIILSHLIDISTIDAKSEDEKKLPSNIKVLINSCPEETKARIWKNLYERCAESAIEDRWSENHYHEHIAPLANSISTCIGKYHYKLKVAAQKQSLY